MRKRENRAQGLMFMKQKFITGILLLLCFAVYGQQTGSIRGLVTDRETGEVLIGVNVLVKGTYYGATTDADGFYFIPDIEPGNYSLEFSYIGYKVVQKTDVKVNPGEVITINVSMESSPLALGQEVEVIGEKPLLDMEETSTVRNMSAEDISNTIANDALQLVSQQVGVVEQDNEIHIRGGRTYEAQYLLDGISVQDPLSGTGYGLNISANAIQEVEVITGGFKAEYGQATSGIVNVKTKSGSDKVEGFFSYKSDHLGVFKEEPFSFNTDHYEFNLSGPEPITGKLLPWINLDVPGKIYLFLNFYTYLSDDYTRATASQLRSSIAPKISLFGHQLTDETTFSPRQNNVWSALFKLTWKIAPKYTLTYAYNRSLAINQNTQSLQTNLEYVEPNPGFPYDFSKNLDNFNTFTHDNEQVSLTWQHTLNNKTFYELRLSRYYAQLRADWEGRHWSEYQQPIDVTRLPVTYFQPGNAPDKIRVIPGDGFYDYGNAFTWHDHYVDWSTIKGDITSVVNDIHTVKAGFEAAFKEMQLIDIADPFVEGGFGSSQDIYRVHPADGAFYLQDDIKFKGFYLDIGARLDWWMPGKFVDRAVLGENSVFTEALQQQYLDETFGIFGNRFKARLMPRLGVSHPVSNNMMLYFNYGHFSKLPRPQFVYAKLGEARFKSAFQRFGNPTLDPETSVKYELGLRYRLTNDDVISINAYYNDIFDYIQTVSIPQVRRGVDGITYINLDYARGRGVEVEYRTRFGKIFSSSINGSYSIITTKSSSSDDGLLVAQNLLEEQPIKEVYARWDRPWQVSWNFAINVPRHHKPKLFGMSLPDNWQLNFRWFAQAGRRYTPVEFQGVRPNDGRPIWQPTKEQAEFFSKIAKHWKWADLSITKYFQIKKLEYGITLEVKNLFDDRNPTIINPVTGDAYRFGDDVPESWNDPRYPDVFYPISSPFPYDPSRWRAPRNIRMGMFLRF